MELYWSRSNGAIHADLGMQDEVASGNYLLLESFQVTFAELELSFPNLNVIDPLMLVIAQDRTIPPFPGSRGIIRHKVFVGVKESKHFSVEKTWRVRNAWSDERRRRFPFQGVHRDATFLLSGTNPSRRYNAPSESFVSCSHQRSKSMIAQPTADL